MVGLAAVAAVGGLQVAVPAAELPALGGPEQRRKDADELAIAARSGFYSAAEVDAILAAASELEAVIDAWGAPFCDGWESFTPDPGWPLPPLS